MRRDSRSAGRGATKKRKVQRRSGGSSGSEADAPSSRKGSSRTVKDMGKRGREASLVSDEDLPLEAKFALLEVENQTLKAENCELRKKLVETLRRLSSAGDASRAPAPSHQAQAEKTRRREEPLPATREERQESPGEQPPPQRPRHRAPRQEGVEPTPAHDIPDSSFLPNAVQLCNFQVEAYNMSVPNNIVLEKRLPLVKEKLDQFLGHFDQRVQILEHKTGRAIIKDWKTFQSRYKCVFRESGAKLKCIVHKRFYYDEHPMSKTSYCLDFETHESLVTATPGTPPDGNLGVREPRTEHLITLYEAKGGKLTRIWLRPDSEKLGRQPNASEEVLLRTDVVKAFEETIKEVRGGALGDRFFTSYHDIPSVG